MSRLLMLILMLTNFLPAFGYADEKSSGASDTDSKSDSVKPSEIVRATQNYRVFCSHCHGFDGRPMALIERAMPDAPDFSLIQWVDYEPEDIFDSVADGVGKMPAFAGLLSKREIELLCKKVLKFPKGTPGSMIRRRSDHYEADSKLVEEISKLRSELQEILENDR